MSSLVYASGDLAWGKTAGTGNAFHSQVSRSVFEKEIVARDRAASPGFFAESTGNGSVLTIAPRQATSSPA